MPNFKDFVLKRTKILLPLVAILSIVSYLLAGLSLEFQSNYPRVFLVVDLISHWQLLYAIVAFCCAIVCMEADPVRKKWYIAYASAPYIILMFSFLPWSFDTEYANDLKLKVLSANVHFDAESIGVSGDLILREYDPHIFAFIEATQKIEPSLKVFDTSKYDIFKQYQSDNFGYVLVAKKELGLKLVSSEHMPEHPIEFTGLLNNKTIAIKLVHYMPPISPEAKIIRDKAVLDTIASMKRDMNYDFNIAIGDFNATSWSGPIREFERNRFHVYLPQVTWPSIFPLIGIDHVISSEKSKILSQMNIRQDNNSDHLAVLAVLSPVKN